MKVSTKIVYLQDPRACLPNEERCVTLYQSCYLSHHNTNSSSYLQFFYGLVVIVLDLFFHGAKIHWVFNDHGVARSNKISHRKWKESTWVFSVKIKKGNFTSTTNISTGLRAGVRGNRSDVERICSMLTCFPLKTTGIIVKTNNYLITRWRCFT